jgi:hypothetical protein
MGRILQLYGPGFLAVVLLAASLFCRESRPVWHFGVLAAFGLVLVSNTVFFLMGQFETWALIDSLTTASGALMGLVSKFSFAVVWGMSAVFRRENRGQGPHPGAALAPVVLVVSSLFLMGLTLNSFRMLPTRTLQWELFVVMGLILPPLVRVLCGVLQFRANRTNDGFRRVYVLGWVEVAAPIFAPLFFGAVFPIFGSRTIPSLVYSLVGGGESIGMMMAVSRILQLRINTPGRAEEGGPSGRERTG